MKDCIVSLVTSFVKQIPIKALHKTFKTVVLDYY